MARDHHKPLTAGHARETLKKRLVDYPLGSDPDPLDLRLKRSKQVAETYPLKLTQPQRETLLHITRLGQHLTRKLTEVGDGTQSVRVTWNQLKTLDKIVGRVIGEAPTVSDERRLLAVKAKLAKLFEAIVSEDVIVDLEPAPRRQRFKKSALLYQFKITLLGIHPAIWRRIQVRDGKLADLHRHIQAAFGWWNYHLHQFTIEGRRYSQPSPDGDDYDQVFEDESKVLLSQLVPASGERSRWKYEYDFGDGWRHEVLFEGCPTIDPRVKYPLCLEGERACPPEDCGGPGGFAQYLAAIRDPEHEEHEEMRKWRGPFDPAAFDAAQATSAMREPKP